MGEFVSGVWVIGYVISFIFVLNSEEAGNNFYERLTGGIMVSPFWPFLLVYLLWKKTTDDNW